MPVRMLKKDEDTKREKGLKKSKMLSGGQVKLDKNKDGKISGEDFKMMGKKRGGSTPGLKNYVKKSDSQEKIIKVIENGITKFVKKSKVMDNPSKYTPAPSSMNSKEKSKGGSPFRKAILERANKRSPGERFSEVDIEFAKQSLKRKKGGRATRKNPNSPKGQNPISEYNRKGKLKYTAANQGGMMAKSTRGYGAARTSGMGLQDEKVKPGKVQKAALGAIALGIGLKKLMDKKGKGLPPGLGAASLIAKKKKDILGKRSGGMMKYKKGGGADSGKVGEMKSKLSVGLMKANKIFGRSKPKKPKAPKQRTMTPLKKMGGGMMMKQYNKGGSVTASCKLGRNKATKLY